MKLFRKKIFQESEFETNVNDIMVSITYTPIIWHCPFRLFSNILKTKIHLNYGIENSLLNDWSVNRIFLSIMKKWSFQNSKYDEFLLTWFQSNYFQHICGVAYTSKLERMLQDLHLSKDLLDQYQIHCQNTELRYSCI